MRELIKEFIFRACREVGPRPASTLAEDKAADLILKEFKKYHSNADKEEVPSIRDYTRRLANLTGIFLVSAIIIFLKLPLASLILLIFSLGFFLENAFFGKIKTAFFTEKFFPIFFKKSKTTNVIVKIGDPNAKKKVLMGAHHDSPNYFWLYHKLGAGTILLIGFVFAVVSLFFLSLFLKIFVFGKESFLFYLTSQLSFLSIPFIIALAFALWTKKPTLGANDNLSGVAVLISLAKWLEENPLKNTEVWLVSFGSEEDQQFGSIGFAKKRFKEMKDFIVINFDLVGEKNLKLLCRQGFIGDDYSEKVSAKMITAAENIGLKLGCLKTGFGGTDSVSFLRFGLKNVSGGIIGLSDSGLPRLWHSLEDRPENLCFENIENAFKIAREFLLQLDAGNKNNL